MIAYFSKFIFFYFQYTPSPNVTIDGFYLNYQPASSAGDYLKITVDGEQTRNYTINYLQPDTSYDMKIQSYTTSGVSDFSPILKQKTLRKYILYIYTLLGKYIIVYNFNRNV